MKRYETTTIQKRWDGKRTFQTTTYPVISPSDSDIIIISEEGDYLDSLAHKYYQDPSLWWIIARANNIGRGKFSIPVGTQLRIPTNVSEILSEMNDLNNVLTEGQ
jgi:nucleoid-associated protein YgaU